MTDHYWHCARCNAFLEHATTPCACGWTHRQMKCTCGLVRRSRETNIKPEESEEPVQVKVARRKTTVRRK